MSDQESFAEVVARYEHRNWIGREAIERLQAAHDREMRNPSLRYMADERTRELDKLSAMAEYHRGYEDGRRAAEVRPHANDALGNERHRAVCELRKLSLDTGSAVKKLATALGIKWNSDNATRSCALIRDRLIHLLGGDAKMDAGIIKSSGDEGGKFAKNAENHQIGQDNGTGDGTCPDNVPFASVADELRECVETATKHYDNVAWHEMDGDAEDEHTWCEVTVAELEGIADRIDARVSDMASDMERIERENDLLQRKLDEIRGIADGRD